MNIKKSKVKEIVFEAALNLSTNLAEKSCVSVDPCFIIDAVNNYKLGVDYRNQYLTTERGEGWIIFVKILGILYVSNLK